MSDITDHSGNDGGIEALDVKVKVGMPEPNPALSSPHQTSGDPHAPPPAVPSPATASQAPREQSTQSANPLPWGVDGVPASSFLQSPFRTRRGGAPSRQQAHPARLWNPTNSTPRNLAPPPSGRPRRPSSPPPPPVPVVRPELAALEEDPRGALGSRAGDFPLLTVPEQREPRPQLSNRASLHLDRFAGAEQRVSLPPSLRHSYDGKRASHTPSPVEEPEAGPSTVVHQDTTPAHLAVPETRKVRSRGLSFTKLQTPIGLSFRPSSRKEDKGKGKAVMAPLPQSPQQDAGDGFTPDLERGPDPAGNNHRHSTASAISGIGSAMSSDSSIMGDPDQPPDNGEEWGPQHPCFPHLNPHVPIDSPEYANTRIIRVRRDWLLEGDLAPTFSNLYPDILDPAGVSEHEFRRVIDKLNSELVPIFSPYAWRNILDNVLGLATGWLWDDLGLTAAKGRLRTLEKWIEQWNADMEKAVDTEEGGFPPKIVPLRRTGYMTLDIQIPDPELAPASPTTDRPSYDGPESLPVQPPPAVTA
ncbi:Golgin subfamily A member 7/ERF4 family-domain-containing protein [Chaetomium sp. MPI-SDFR-AT-0129]|nr:Golgin subfamily A member 7/ERF4 family-domain-containing protein [Chaetomium sp. MPI-SDFR-AT-0129]